MKKVFALIVTVTVLMSFSVSAHEFSKPMRWTRMEGDTYVLDINAEKIGSNSMYKAYIFPAIDEWNKSIAKTDCNYEYSFSYSTVDILTPTEDFWDTLLPSLETSGTSATTALTDTNGYIFTSKKGLSGSNGKIRYAAIYFNPNEPKDKTPKKTVVHEIGHVWGFAHVEKSERVESVMVQGYTLFNGNTIEAKLYNHDIYDLVNFYGEA